jgi:hypothetical protein
MRSTFVGGGLLALVLAACQGSQPAPQAVGSSSTATPSQQSISPTPEVPPSPTPPPPARLPARVTNAPYRPKIDPARFTTTIDNPYFPLTPGTTYRFEGVSSGGNETNAVAVTARTKKILGVTCVVVRDEVRTDGRVTELTFDWYAQDADGNVWYFGEDSRDYSGGTVTSTHGSWQAGVDGAQPGIVMPGVPTKHVTYRQEYLPGEAEDQARVLALNGSASVPYGSFEDLVVTRDWSPLEPSVIERKFYAKGVGLVLERLVSGAGEFSRLVDVRRS